MAVGFRVMPGFGVGLSCSMAGQELNGELYRAVPVDKPISYRPLKGIL